MKQHLVNDGVFYYIFSSEELPKVGDWILANGSPYKVKKIFAESFQTDLCWISGEVYKIVETNNPDCTEIFKRTQ